jgi:hypothetical protein
MSRREKRLKALHKLKELTLLYENPCSVRWQDMENDPSGDRRVKYCSFCQLKVYDFCQLSPEAILELLRLHEGKLCAQCYVRADGTVTLTHCDESEHLTIARGGIGVSDK